jgi:hypothetical protein
MTDLLKEAIADAKAVREVALANAKLALEEAFTPRIQSMLATKLSEEAEAEDEEMSEGDEEEMSVEEGDDEEMEMEEGEEEEMPVEEGDDEEAPAMEEGDDEEMPVEEADEEEMPVEEGEDEEFDFYSKVEADGGGEIAGFFSTDLFKVGMRAVTRRGDTVVVSKDPDRSAHLLMESDAAKVIIMPMKRAGVE